MDLAVDVLVGVVDGAMLVVAAEAGVGGQGVGVDGGTRIDGLADVVLQGGLAPLGSTSARTWLGPQGLRSMALTTTV